MTHDEMIEVLAAAKAHKHLQWRVRQDCSIKGCIWEEMNNPDHEFDFQRFEYRIKPEPKYRPWRTVDEVPVGQVIVRKDEFGQANKKVLLLGAERDRLGKEWVIWAYFRAGKFSMPYVLKEYTMLDGTPCGVKE